MTFHINFALFEIFNWNAYARVHTRDHEFWKGYFGLTITTKKFIVNRILRFINKYSVSLPFSGQKYNNFLIYKLKLKTNTGFKLDDEIVYPEQSTQYAGSDPCITMPIS